MALDAAKKDVYDLLKGRKYIIKENQRKYVWKKDNWRELIEDVSLVYEKNVNEHFIGSVVLMAEPKSNGFREIYSVIDGQQRISTLTIALIGISLLFLDLGEEDLFSNTLENLFVRDEDNNMHPIVSEEANVDISGLVLALHAVKERSKQRIKGTTNHLAELFSFVHPSKLVRECLEFFYDSFRERIKNESIPSDILKEFRRIIFNIRYIEIVAKDKENAYSIFEVLNARGQMLKEHELLRNYMLRYSSQEYKTDIDNYLDIIEKLLGDSYDVFLKHYALHKYNKRTDREGNRPYKVIAMQEKKRDMYMLAIDLHKKAEFYAKMSNVDESTCSQLEKKVFSYFKRRRQQQFKPLLLGVMNQLKEGRISQAEYDRWIEFLYKFFICYHVIGGVTSNRIEDIVGKYSYLVEMRYESDILAKFKESVVKSIPNEQTFIAKLKGLTYSNKWTAHREKTYRENIRAIFEIVEDILGYSSIYDGLTIEHCYNDSVGENNSHVGNLMLLEGDLNEKCRNKDVLAKATIYETSKLCYPKKVAEVVRANGSMDTEHQTEYIAKLIYDAIHSTFAAM